MPESPDPPGCTASWPEWWRAACEVDTGFWLVLFLAALGIVQAHIDIGEHTRQGAGGAKVATSL